MPSTPEAEPGEESNPRHSLQAAKRKANAVSDDEEAENDERREQEDPIAKPQNPRNAHQDGKIYIHPSHSSPYFL